MKAIKYVIFFINYFLFQLNIHSQPKVLFLGTLNPIAQFDVQQNIICRGRCYTGGFPIIAQKIDRKLNFLWSLNEFGIKVTDPTWNDETRGGPMLALKDGSVIFACQYMQYLGNSIPDE